MDATGKVATSVVCLIYFLRAIMIISGNKKTTKIHRFVVIADYVLTRINNVLCLVLDSYFILYRKTGKDFSWTYTKQEKTTNICRMIPQNYWSGFV